MTIRVFTEQQLVEALNNVKGLHEMAPELIAADVFASTHPAEQAEAERPEVVARVVHSNPVVLGQCGPLNANDELMTVAQHAASVARWAEMFNRVEQQRDAALVEVERLRESKGDPVGSLEKCMKVMYERDEHAKRLEAALARVAELEAELETERMRLSACATAALGYFDGCADAYKSASLSDVLRLRGDCDAALAEIAELEKKLAMALDAASKGDAARHAACGMEMEIQELKAKLAEIAGDFLPDNSGQAELALNEMRQALHELLGSAPAQAQHSVPEGWLIELGFDVLDRQFRFADAKSHLPTIKIVLPACEVDDSAAWELRNSVAARIEKLIAAAPGKEDNDNQAAGAAGKARDA